jgi:two-component system phosphate regulon sensor histidine kinase PhoR
MNLVDNAVNYTPAGGMIQVSAWSGGDFVYVSVRDTGIGIAKEDQKRIFERFYRADHEGVLVVPGTGLGLSIVQSLVEMHGGRMELESQPGQGSTFTFSLPVAPGEEPGDASWSGVS